MKELSRFLFTNNIDLKIILDLKSLGIYESKRYWIKPFPVASYSLRILILKFDQET